MASPHKIYGPQANDLALQLRENRVDQVVLAGMSANLCTWLLAAIITFRYLADALWTTDEAVGRISG